MTGLLQDLRYALRQLRKSPGFTAAAVLTLALGIGANTAIFGLIDAVLLRNLPVRNPDRLVLLGDGLQWGMISGIDREYSTFSYPQYRYFQQHNQLFVGLCAFGSEDATVRVRKLGSSDAAETAVSKVVSGNYFDVLGVPAIVGRSLLADDDRPEAPPSVVLSYRYWAKEYGRSPAVIGQKIDVNGTVFTVVGVAPPEFFGETVEASPAEMWFPIAFQSQVAQRPVTLLSEPDARWLHIMGRLQPGAAFAQAEAALTGQLHQFLLDNTGTKVSQEDLGKISRAHIRPTNGGLGISHLRVEYSEPLHILMAIVGLVLLVACANLATLLLAKAMGRQREVSLRLALGAGKCRLLRQLLTESVLLAFFGGTAGLLIALVATHALLAVVFRGADTLPVDVALSLRLLIFLLAICAAAGIAFGLAPALRASRQDLVFSLKTGTQPGTGGRQCRFGLSQGLVVAQIAASLLLIVGAVLLVRSLNNLLRQDFGFEQHGVLIARIDPKIAGYKTDQLEGLYQLLRERINALPGVADSGVALYTPLTGDNWSGNAAIADYTPEQNKGVFAAFNRVSPGYFEAMGIPVLMGRSIGNQDAAGTPDVAVINQSMSHRYFPEGNPLGKRFGWDDSVKTAFEVIGVVKDTKHDYLRDETPPMFFLPITQKSDLGPDEYVAASYAKELVVRSTGNPDKMAVTIRRALQEVAPNLPVLTVSSMDDRISASTSGEQLTSGFATFFGVVALLLASIGLYGLMAYAVARRTNEIGIRMALGAQTKQVLWLVLREILLLVGVGIAVGIPLALGVSRLIQNQLFGVSANDPLTLAMSIPLLAGVALLAGCIPARRAAKVDPIVALRYE